MSKWEIELKKGAHWLADHDARLAPLVEQFGLPSFQPHKNYYQELVESIISQQLSVKAAASITKRFVGLFGHFPAPDEIVAAETEDLRGCGLSYAKVRCIKDLAMRVIDGTVKFDHLDRLSSNEIIAELTAVKGIEE